jgi:hypothetical protein
LDPTPAPPEPLVSRPVMVVGWRERVALPALGIRKVVAKIDTGARTSALHATRIRLFDKDGAPWVSFRVPHAGLARTAHCEAPLIGRRQIRNTGGVAEERLVIETTLAIAGRRWRIEVSLADRGAMAAPLILGRTAIRRRRIVVDAGHSFLTSLPNPATLRKDCP